MRMRQSISQLERAFIEEVEADRARAEAQLHEATLRSRRRRLEKTHKRGSLRFAGLILVLIATAVLVTIAMFETLYVVIG
jgi:hypothetical protein